MLTEPQLNVLHRNYRPQEDTSKQQKNKAFDYRLQQQRCVTSSEETCQTTHVGPYGNTLRQSNARWDLDTREAINATCLARGL